MTAGTGYVDARYLDAAAALVRDAKARSHDWMRLRAGDSALDVGCGPGTDTRALAARVGPAGRVVGIDHDAEMVAEADRRAAEEGLAAVVTHLEGSALALPFADGAFDAARSERLFLHLAEPERALAEMIRVVRPGGWVVVADTDWGSRSVDAPDVAAERAMARVLAERLLANGYSGRRLYGMMRRAGLEELRVHVEGLPVTDYGLWRLLSRMELAERAAVDSGALPAAAVAALDASLRAADADGAFFAITSLVLVAGRVGGGSAGGDQSAMETASPT